MRVLFVSGFYPPFEIGGWEQNLQEITEHLTARGWATHVLTSSHGVGPQFIKEVGVDRSLELESPLYHYDPVRCVLGRTGRVSRNLERTREVIRRFKPDVICVFGMWNLSRAIPRLAEQLMPGRVVYYVANDWPYAEDVHISYWRQPAEQRSRRILKAAAARATLSVLTPDSVAFPLRFDHVLCVSHAIKADLARLAGIPEERMTVIYNGIDLDRFISLGRSAGAVNDRKGLSLLYAGSLVSHKGVFTAVEAMALLRDRVGSQGVTLTIVGAGHPDYEAGLKVLVEKEGLADRVRFHGRVTRDEMPALLPRFDVLVFPSTWEEPLARMVQEAMAAGLVVIGTTTGGTKEILIEGETGLTFPPNDAAALARQIERLNNDEVLRKTLMQQARECVRRKFDIHRMVDNLEEYLLGMVHHTQLGLGSNLSPWPAAEKRGDHATAVSE